MPFARSYFHPANVPAGGYLPNRVAAAYNFPTWVASGYTVGLIELGGQYYPADLQTFCQAANLPMPSVVAVPVQGAAIVPDPGNADVEVGLDVQIVAAVAPAVAIRIYFADNTEAGFAAAVVQALSECDAVSCSWGAPEDDWTSAGMQALSQAIDASSTPFFVASGDSGSSDGEKGKHVDYPSSDPGSIGCGGTTLPASATGSPDPSQETGWPDGGGGVSASFARPAYQSGVPIAGSKRCVPDVAACADPNTPYNIYVNGQWQQVGGTSAVAPLIASLFVLLKTQNNSLTADVSNLLYSATGMCRDITAGSNGAYSASIGFDLVTGLGVPLPAALLPGSGSAPPPASPPPPPVSSPPPSPPPVSSPPPGAPPVNVKAIQKALARLNADVASLETLLAPLTD